MYLNASQEWVKVNLMHRPVIQVRAEAITPMFLIIRKEVLRASLYPSTLDTNNCFVSSFAIEIWFRSEAVVGEFSVV